MPRPGARSSLDGRRPPRLAERLVVEALRGGLERKEAGAAAVLAAWAMSSGHSTGWRTMAVMSNVGCRWSTSRGRG